VRRNLGLIVGLGSLAVLLVGTVMAGNSTSDVLEVQQLRQRIDRVRLTGPHRPPELVPPRAPGREVTA
jgi:hypothetical protein